MNKTHKLAVAGMLTALGILLPFAAAHGMGIPGTVLLPMHLPVFLLGFICGPWYGLICGILIPCLNTALTGMPKLFPTLPVIVCELMTYGTVSGILYGKTPLGRKKYGIYPCLIISMLCGKIMYAFAFFCIAGKGFGGAVSAVTAAAVTGLPGIAVQLLIIPPTVCAVSNVYKLKQNAEDSAITVIKEERATCVAVKEGKIIKTETGSGIAPLLRLLDENNLRGNFIADKIIGKAAANILLLGEAAGCYGEVMSRDAYEFLKKNGINARYGTLTEYIVNRKGDGRCPMEQAVRGKTTPEAAVEAIRKKLKELKMSSQS